MGPRAVALAAWCSKGLGLPARKVARLLGQLGLALTRGGVTQVVVRAAHQTCLAHLLRRVGELLADAKRGQATTPMRVPVIARAGAAPCRRGRGS